MRRLGAHDFLTYLRQHHVSCRRLLLWPRFSVVYLFTLVEVPMKLTFSFDDEGAARVFRFMDGVCDLYATLLDDRATTALREHLECFVSRQFDIEPLGCITLHASSASGTAYHTHLAVSELRMCRDLAEALRGDRTNQAFSAKYELHPN